MSDNLFDFSADYREIDHQLRFRLGLYANGCPHKVDMVTLRIIVYLYVVALALIGASGLIISHSMITIELEHVADFESVASFLWNRFIPYLIMTLAITYLVFQLIDVFYFVAACLGYCCRLKHCIRAILLTVAICRHYHIEHTNKMAASHKANRTRTRTRSRTQTQANRQTSQSPCAKCRGGNTQCCCCSPVVVSTSHCDPTTTTGEQRGPLLPDTDRPQWSVERIGGAARPMVPAGRERWRRLAPTTTNLNQEAENWQVVVARLELVATRIDTIVSTVALMCHEIGQLKRDFTSYLNLELLAKVPCIILTLAAVLKEPIWSLQSRVLIVCLMGYSTPVVVLTFAAAAVEHQFKHVNTALQYLMARQVHLTAGHTKRLIIITDYLNHKSNVAFVVASDFALTFASVPTVSPPS